MQKGISLTSATNDTLNDLIKTHTESSMLEMGENTKEKRKRRGIGNHGKVKFISNHTVASWANHAAAAVPSRASPFV